MNYPQIIKTSTPAIARIVRDFRDSESAIANFVRDAGMNDRKLTEWVTQPANPPLEPQPRLSLCRRTAVAWRTWTGGRAAFVWQQL